MLHSADKLYGDVDFIFQDLAPVHTAKSSKTWFNDHGITVLDCPVNLPNINPIEKRCTDAVIGLATYYSNVEYLKIQNLKK